LGGGIYAREGAHGILDRCIIENNRATTSSGGLYLTHAFDWRLEACTVRRNDLGQTPFAFGPVGLFTELSSVVLRDCHFYDNGVDSPGSHAGACSISRSIAVIENTVFRDNQASSGWGGGALCVSGSERSDVTLRYCLIENNTGVGSGGGVVLDMYDRLLMEDCEIVNNHASSAGGVLARAYADLTLRRCRITDNSAGNYGGGISIDSPANARWPDSPSRVGRSSAPQGVVGSYARRDPVPSSPIAR